MSPFALFNPCQTQGDSMTFKTALLASTAALALASPLAHAQSQGVSKT